MATWQHNSIGKALPGAIFHNSRLEKEVLASLAVCTNCLRNGVKALLLAFSVELGGYWKRLDHAPSAAQTLQKLCASAGCAFAKLR